MSQIKIEANPSGGGIYTLQSGAGSTDRTITLPDKAGAIAVGAGTIVQVVQNTYATQVRTGSNALIDTGLNATITPTSTSNKILVIVQQSGCHKDSSNTYGTLRLYRGSSHVITWEGQFGYNGANTANSIGTCGGQWLDSPATTSATTYKTVFSSVNNNNWVYVQVANDNSTMTLIEVVV